MLYSLFLLILLSISTASHAALPGFLTARHLGIEETTTSHIPPEGTVITNRHGHAIAYNASIAQRALSEGTAICYFQHDMLTAEECHTMEVRARNATKGLWKNIPQLTHQQLEQGLDDYRGKFVLVTGVIQEISETKARTYINLGGDWKTDTTLMISAKNRLAFPEDITLLVGQSITARGWVERYNGPVIKLRDPMQWDTKN